MADPGFDRRGRNFFNGCGGLKPYQCPSFYHAFRTLIGIFCAHQIDQFDQFGPRGVGEKSGYSQNVSLTKTYPRYEVETTPVKSQNVLSTKSTRTIDEVKTYRLLSNQGQLIDKWFVCDSSC